MSLGCSRVARLPKLAHLYYKTVLNELCVTGTGTQTLAINSNG
jgi:hypothetical protein